MDLPVETAFKRMQSRTGETDRLEGEGLEFMCRVRNAYLEMSVSEKRIVVLDATAPIEKVFENIERKVWEVLKS